MKKQASVVVSSFRELQTFPAQSRAIRALRNATIFVLSVGKSIRRSTGWIRFPYYHHVFEDERRGFARQMSYLRNYGEFISLGRAVALLNGGDPIDGRYFCVTFDDGLACCHDGAMPILVERGIPAAFFIVTDYTASDDEERVCRPLHARSRYAFEYLTWAECREMVQAGMTIGSHTCSHAKLADLDIDEAYLQMRQSKRIIEEQLGTKCHHFACPWGRAGVEFDPQRDIDLAKKTGYKSFLTTQRGKNHAGSSPFAIRRDNTYANWGNDQLRYFLSL